MSPKKSSPSGLPARLRAAREARKLSLDAAARALGVSKSSVARWEGGALKPRDNWDEIERVYGKSRLELEFGIDPSSGPGGDPPYPDWPRFLDWIESSPVQSEVRPWMVSALRQVRVEDGQAMTLEGYRGLLLAMITHPPKSDRE